jgi:6-phosphogluconolactonase (cycloisomerase 2 family)
MRAPLLFAATACTVLLGCNNEPDQQVTGLPSTRPMTATPASTAPLFGYAVAKGRGGSHAGAGISAFTIDPTNGTLNLAQTLPFKPDDLPSSVAIEPTRRFAYVLGSGSDRIRVYSVDQRTGALALQPKEGFTAGPSPAVLAVAPSGSSLYVADAKASGVARMYQFTLNPSDGSVAPMQPASIAVSVDPTAVTIDPSGRFAYLIDKAASEIQVLSIDSATGALKAGAKPMAVGEGPSELTIDATSKYGYVVSNAGISPFVIGDDGSLKSSGTPIGAATDPHDVDFDPSATTAYVTDDKGVATYVFNLASGTLKLLDEVAEPSTAPASCTATGSKFVYVTATDKNTGATTISTLTIDEDTGKLKAVPHASAAAGYNAACLVIASPQ